MKTLALTILMGAIAGATVWAMAWFSLPYPIALPTLFLTGAAMMLVLARRTLWSNP